jgi:hypothetical protein
MNAITNHFAPPIVSNVFNTIHEASKELANKVQAIASNTFVQIAASLALNLAFGFLVGAPLLPISVHLLTIACKVTLAALHPLLEIWQACRSPQSGNPLKSASKSLAHTSIINTVTLKISNYIHELGHAAAAVACYIRADPTISVHWNEGLTVYNISYGLTKFGEFLGEENALLFSTAAGIFTPVICAMAEFAVAHHIKEGHPIISELLNAHGLSQLFNTALYGISAFVTSKLTMSHDFIFLWIVGGIHPLFPIGCILLLPLCEYALLNL